MADQDHAFFDSLNDNCQKLGKKVKNGVYKQFYPAACGKYRKIISFSMIYHLYFPFKKSSLIHTWNFKIQVNLHKVT